ncbi:platelet-activating factor acetylhydrolase, isoform II-domain-containing protein [Podospora australis]|uniref:Putative phospholipase n=1 Tax=Podospora australis TaxID=1536484 RepID=A0AAN6X0F4_9PEZI|nr:platelet-activating factor acetylhydrolase, isoform II-domain-containing protein [Podospora australis]
MASITSRFNFIPSFPDYTGPYKVGTVDVEVPVSELPSSPKPEGREHIHTVSFRIFYPSVPESKEKRITWLPAPQRLHVAAYAQFLGIGSATASFLSFIPRHLHWTTIPVHKNATLQSPPPEQPRSRWPTVIFSHGLGGHRNAYSHLAGSLASYGVVVICPEHRDHSAALSLVRDPQNQNRVFTKNTRHSVPYHNIPHTQRPDIWEKRNKQLRIRLWEIDLLYEAILSLDRGDENLVKSNLNRSTPATALSRFTDRLDVLEPGTVIWAGHSFGASTMVQFLKSVYYSSHSSIAGMRSPLFTPRPNSAVKNQIIPASPTILLDMWCFPLLSAATDALFRLPLPCYAEGGRGGSGLLAVESEQFFKWGDHLRAKARILSADPFASEFVVENNQFNKPYFFRVEKAAHLSQSDFAILFPWLTKKAFGSDHPERVLRLNTRAVLQFLRVNGVRVSRTSKEDLVEGGSIEGEENDPDILGRVPADGTKKVEAWHWIDIVGMKGSKYPSELEILKKETDKENVKKAEEEEKRMGEEMDPSAGGLVEEAVVNEGTK